MEPRTDDDLPQPHVSEAKRRHRRSLSRCFDELKVLPPTTPTSRFGERVGHWVGDDAAGEGLDYRADTKADDDEEDVERQSRPSTGLLRWRGVSTLDETKPVPETSLSHSFGTDSVNDGGEGKDDDGDGSGRPSSLGRRIRALSQGLMPGTSVVLKEGNLKAVILRKSLFDGALRYLVKLNSTGEESEKEAAEIEIAEPPLGWIVRWASDDRSGEDEGTIQEMQGLVVGASWFREEKKVEVEVGDSSTCWKELTNVRFVEPMEGTRVAVNVEEDGDFRVKAGVVEGSSMFRGNSRFQVKFDDDGGDGWFDLDSFVSPNEFRNF
mmetsp:Transcript_13795/g.27509  ORF Transcript_13795/g.27509 Transcript_13795/m.27509 type:complete len:323 (-) Transcript_13795:25-993(-)